MAEATKKVRIWTGLLVGRLRGLSAAAREQLRSHPAQARKTVADALKAAAKKAEAVAYRPRRRHAERTARQSRPRRISNASSSSANGVLVAFPRVISGAASGGTSCESGGQPRAPHRSGQGHPCPVPPLAPFFPSIARTCGSAPCAGPQTARRQRAVRRRRTQRVRAAFGFRPPGGEGGFPALQIPAAAGSSLRLRAGDNAMGRSRPAAPVSTDRGTGCEPPGHRPLHDLTWPADLPEPGSDSPKRRGRGFLFGNQPPGQDRFAGTGFAHFTRSSGTGKPQAGDCLRASGTCSRILRPVTCRRLSRRG